MSISKEFKGKTLEEALRNASDALNTKEENLHYKILSEKKGFKKEVIIEIEEAKVEVPNDYLGLHDLDPLLQKTIEFITELIANLGVSILEYELQQEQENHYYLNLQCGEIGAMIIGKRGTVLNSIQFLVSSFSSKVGSPYFLMVDIGGYRKKQERNLRDEVYRVAQRVHETQKSFLLHGPYSPIERKQIHVLIKDYFPNLYSISEGDGFLKAVWIENQR